MFLIEWVFWVSLFLLSYTYIGYFVLLKILSKKVANTGSQVYLPAISIIIPAYNEEAVIKEKIQNTLSLDYPAEKKKILVITDGSTDKTNELVQEFEESIILIRHQKRLGKTASVNRAMEYVNTNLVVVTDANTMLSADSLLHIVGHFLEDNIGGVCGEKKIAGIHKGSAAQFGESLYWRYESVLKKTESDYFSVMGAVGELFAFRKELFRPIPENIICDDLYLSTSIGMRGFKVSYDSRAIATELPSPSLMDEMKRKTRISAGNLQAVFYLRRVFNIFKHPRLSFLFISHRIMRWFIAPLCLIVALVTNIILVAESSLLIYKISLMLQVAFYLLAVAGFLLSLFKRSIVFFSVPFYFCFMNCCLIIGYFQFLSGRQNVQWQKVNREQSAVQSSG